MSFLFLTLQVFRLGPPGSACFVFFNCQAGGSMSFLFLTLQVVENDKCGLMACYWSKVLQVSEYDCLDCDFLKGIRFRLKETNEVPSLKDLSSKFITKDGGYFNRLIPFLPCSLFPYLMEIALQNERYNAVLVLLRNWPYPSFILASIIKPSYQYLNNIFYLESYISRYTKFTKMLIDSFMNIFCNFSHSSKLKIMNLTGFPTDAIDLCHLLRYFYGQVTSHSAKDTNKKLIPFPKDCQIDPYTIQMDCVINNNVYKMLYHLYQTRALVSPLRIEFFKIYCFELGSSCITQLLTTLHSQPLTGISLSFNSLDNEGFKLCAVSLKAFPNIISLDLSGNRISIQNDQDMSAFLAVLKSLPHLSRLNLADIRLTNHLNALSNIRNINTCAGNNICIEVKQEIRTENFMHGLEYLNLSDCRLAQGDIEYLIQSHHISTLKELILNGNFLDRYMQSVIKLIKALEKTIYILEIQFCFKEKNNLFSIMSLLSNFSNLGCVAYAHYELESTDIYQQLPYLGVIDTLRIITFNYPVDVYNKSVDRFGLVDKNTYDDKRFKEICQNILNEYGRDTEDNIQIITYCY